MNVRERFRAVMNFQPCARLPLVEWATWWDQTIRRWHGEGLPPHVRERDDITRYFGLDLYWQDWIPVRRPTCPNPPAHGAPLVATMDDYLSIRPHLYPDPAEMTDRWQRWRKMAAEQQAGRAVLWFTLEGFFWFPRSLLGIEGHLYAFHDEPELMHRINADLADWHVRIIEHIGRICQADFMTFAEDLSYNNGPMLSREQFERFLKPGYARVVPVLQALGTLPLVDSDGDITLCTGWFEQAGIAGILPLERQAGVDIARLRASHPRMRFMGHYDKIVMPHGETAMRKEFQRLVPVAGQGGFIISVDHQTPPGVSLESYRAYLRLFREHAELAGELSRRLAGRG
jgi:hypothetical protein